MSVGYSPRTDELLKLLPPLTERELADLAIACAAEVGLSPAEQLRLSTELSATIDREADRREALAARVAAARSKP